ncbi:MAG: hypothetical protein K940chlam8_00886 [Chlamydiae bacterium]|nr:hypothetical protein [Chlamydiota bacterium]
MITSVFSKMRQLLHIQALRRPHSFIPPFYRLPYQRPIAYHTSPPLSSRSFKFALIPLAAFVFLTKKKTDDEKKLLETSQKTYKYAHLFINSSIDLTQNPEDYFEAVLTACKNRQWDKVRDAIEELKELKDMFGRSLFIACVEQGLEESVKDIIKDPALRPLCEKDFSKAIHSAAKRGFDHIIQILVEEGADFNGIEDGKTPLHVAIENKQKRTVQALINNGADVTIKSLYSNPSDPSSLCHLDALAFATSRGEKKIFDILIEKTELDLRTLNTEIGNLLHVAIQFNQYFMLEHLLTKHFNKAKVLINAQNSEGKTPLHLASSLENLRAIYFLIQDKGALVESKGPNGNTALHIAVLRRKRNAIKLLSYLGANLDAKNDQHHTPYRLVESSNDLLSTQCQGLLKTLATNTIDERKEPPKFDIYPPENLVFKGGGAKGLAYIGVIKALEEKDWLKDIKRIAGTSAGAITAAFVALGMDSKQMEDKLTETPLTKLLDHPFRKKRLQEVLKQHTSLQNLYSWILHPGKILDPNTLFSALWNGVESLWRTTGVCKGDEALKWIEDQIELLTDDRHCTFGKLKELIEKDKTHKYKHLHVFATELNHPQIVHISSEDPQWKDMLIADAVRISMSIPGVFEPYTPRFKNKKGFYDPKEVKSYIDGGLLNNLPIECFDQVQFTQNDYLTRQARQPVYNRRTLGFDLYSPEELENQPNKKIETVGDLLRSVYEIYTRAELLIRQQNPYNKHRVIKIDNMGVGTLNFGVKGKKRNDLIDSGKQSTLKFLGKEEKQNFLFQLLETTEKKNL